MSLNYTIPRVFLGCLWAGVASAQQPRDLQRGEGARGGSVGRNLALVIGVEQYADPGISDLSFAEDDAVAVARALVASDDYASEDVILMTGEGDPTLQPTLHNIYDQLARLRGVQDVGTVLVFFSGHGVVGGDEGSREYFILPSDTLLSSPYKTGVRVQDLLDAMGEVESQARVAILDACRNRLEAGEKGAGRKVPQPDKVPSAKGTYVLYSTSFEDVSRELSPQQQELLGGVSGRGAFTYYLEQGLVGLADGAGGREPDGVVTASELYRFTSAGLDRLPGKEGTQEPRATCSECDIEMDFPVLRRRSMAELQVQSPIPSSAAELKVALERARMAYESDEGAGFLGAVQEAERRVRGLAEVLSPELAADWHRVVALREWRLKDRARARVSLGAAHAAAPWQAPRFGLPESDLALLALADIAAHAAVDPDEPFYPLPGVTLLIDGEEVKGWPTGRPYIVQGRTCLGEVQRTELVEVGAAPPPFAGLNPLPLPCRWDRAKPVAVGAGLSLGLAGGLFAGALAAERAYGEAEPTLGEGEDDHLATRANRLGYAAQGSALVAAGLGVTTLAMVIRF